MRYYLGPYVENVDDVVGETTWLPPVGVVGSVNLSPAKDEVPSIGFFAVASGALSARYVEIGVSLYDKASASVLLAWKNLTGADVKAGTVLDLLWDTLTIYADSSGIAGPFPIMPTHMGFLELHLGGHSLVRKERLVKGGRNWPVIQKTLQNIFDEVEANDRKQSAKIISAWANKIKGSVRADFVRKGKPVPEKVKFGTTYSDSFTGSDNTNIEAHDANWEQSDDGVKPSPFIFSNKLSYNAGNSFVWCRYNLDLSFDDMFTTVVFSKLPDAWFGAVVTARVGSSDYSGYNLRMTNRTDQGYTSALYYHGTQLANSNATPALGTYVLTCDGSSISVTKNGSPFLSATDTNLVGQYRGGLGSGYSQSGGGPLHDSWSVEDIEPVVSYAISGHVTLSGVGVEGAVVRCIRQSDNVAIAEETTDSEGFYSFSSLDVDDLYHLAVEYEVGEAKYNALSYWDIVPLEE